MSPSRSALVAVVAVLVPLVLGVPAAAQEPVEYEPVVPTFTAREGATIHQGIEGDASYAIEVPDEWVGGLVLYAHGFRGDLVRELTVDAPPLRDAFLQSGYAWAASSFSSNGYGAVDAAVDETHELIALTENLTGVAPTQVLVHGFSLGGHVTAAALERYPGSYAGALPACGALGDVALFDYFADAALVAYAEAGVDPTWPPPPDLLERGELQQVAAALGTGPDARLTGAGHRYASVLEQLSGGERPTFDAALELWTRPDEETGLPFLLNVYGGALSGGPDPRNPPLVATEGQLFAYAVGPDGQPRSSPAARRLNDRVLRQAADPDAEPYFPVVDGDPGVPVLSLHTIGDLFVPFSMEQIYATEAEANGAGEQVVIRAIRDVGHCAFSSQELVTAWADLLSWVNDGVRPAGDAVDPQAVRARDYGCQFTVGETDTRGLVPTCPDAASAERASGTDRYATAASVSRRAHPDGADTVLVARGDLPVDALAAAPVAGTSAPVLLSRPHDLPSEAADEIARLGASTVVLLGGEAALSTAVAADAADVAGVTSVERVGGADRYATSAQLAELAPGTSDAQVYLVSGEGSRDGDFADAMSVAALAAHTGVPLLLAAPHAEGLPPPTAEALGNFHEGLLTVVGGAQAVSDDEVAAAAKAQRAAHVERLAGADRYGTSAVVAGQAVGSGLELNRPWLATGRSAADALAAGPAAAAQGQALLLVDGRSGPTQPIADLLSDFGPLVSTVVVVGGPGAVDPAVVDGVLSVVERPATG